MGLWRRSVILAGPSAALRNPQAEQVRCDAPRSYAGPALFPRPGRPHTWNSARWSATEKGGWPPAPHMGTARGHRAVKTPSSTKVCTRPWVPPLNPAQCPHPPNLGLPGELRRWPLQRVSRPLSLRSAF